MPEGTKIHWRYLEKGVLTIYQLNNVRANKLTEEKQKWLELDSDLCIRKAE